MRISNVIPRRGTILLVLVSLSGTGAQVATPPLSTTQQTRPPILPGTGRNGQDDEESNTPMARQIAEQQALRRNNERQKLIVDDTAKLVHLAQQLKNDMDAGKAANSGKTAEEIEKLAKTVKDKMKEGQ